MQAFRFNENLNIISLTSIILLFQEQNIIRLIGLPCIKTVYLQIFLVPEQINVIEFFIRNEGPISERLLFKKVLNQFSISKNTKSTKAVFNELLYNKPSNFTNNVKFYRDKEEDKNNVNYYRVGSKYREFIDIPKEEILVAIKDIMKIKLSLNRDELIKYIVSAFGFNKVGDAMKEVVNTAIDFAQIKEFIRIDGDNIFYQE